MCTLAKKIIALKIDVDTYQGMRRGTLNLLNILHSFQIKATFFISFGPDNSGKAIWNIFKKKGFLDKMVRTKAAKLYGFKTLFYGTLLPAPIISANSSEIIKQVSQAGHEIGVHAWNHRLWQDHLDKLSPTKIKDELRKAFDAYGTILGYYPKSTAAPAWYCNEMSLTIQDSLNLTYCSDTRGEIPFYPKLNNKTFKTLQIPTTAPCIEEMVGLNGINQTNLVSHLVSSLDKDGLNILPIHAEIEGMSYQEHFKEFIAQTISEGFHYTTLLEVAQTALKHKEKIPLQTIYYGEIRGRSGLVSRVRCNSN